MIERLKLLSDLQSLLRRLEADLRERHDEMPEIAAALEAEYAEAKQQERTAQSYGDWLSDYATQVAAAWVLSCVFARFLEDNSLVEPPRIAGPGERLRRARDEHELYFRRLPSETDRHYLLHVFNELAELPGGKEVFGEHNLVHELPAWLSGDAAGELLKFFQKIDANTGHLVHDFTDDAWDTRFVGDLYQDLSEAARKKHALMQTPEFVEEFILDRTLDRAIEEFGLEGFKMIDPACGSGHFLLGSFHRLLERWRREEPGTKVSELAQRALDSVHGVDVNPYAVAIARFRLLLAAMQACGVKRLDDAPQFHFNLAVGDSLRHGTPGGEQLGFGFTDPYEHHYRSEQGAELKRILRPCAYHAVVANPPYITPKDRAANRAYRESWTACHMKYSLSVPFMQRIFHLAISPSPRGGEGRGEGAGGFTGQITSNSFMKREFGKKLIESFLPKVDLTHVIDTSGAYIPGHGTPTVILLGRNRLPVANTVRAAMGIRGEPSTPDDPAQGLVWSAIVAQVDQPGSESDFVSVSDSERERFHSHPWSIGGGGAAELKEDLEQGATETLSVLSDSIGITSFTLEDDIYLLPNSAARRWRLGSADFREMVVGDAVRDWTQAKCDVAVFPYDDKFQPIEPNAEHASLQYLFMARTCLANNKMFGGRTKVETGLKWYEYGRLTSAKLRTPLSIVFAFVATHNHFVLDRGGKVFNRSAPVIKLPPEATEGDHLALLGLLNSSVGCFWCQQTMHNKGGPGGASSKDEKWHDFFEFAGTRLLEFPVPDVRPTEASRRLNTLARELSSHEPAAVIASSVDNDAQAACEGARSAWRSTRKSMIAMQEELDWRCYHLYGLIDEELYIESPPPIELGQRAFEIDLARRMAAGDVQTKWFDWLGITTCCEIPTHWPDEYRQIIERRIQLIGADRNIRLVEQTNTKRRWEVEPWKAQLERALREWLLGRLEGYFDFDGRMNDQRRPTAKIDPAITSTAKLADVAGRDEQFMQVAELYRGDPAFDVHKLVAELVEAEQVPLLPVLRYKPAGLRKRKEWEETWELQRQEDAIDARTKLPADDPQHLSELEAADLKKREVGDIAVPPKYKSSEFAKSSYWKLRGKLDVPKERWVSLPHCEGEDGALPIAWAGYDHLQLATAIGQYFQHIKDVVGGAGDPRLEPLLAAIAELIPWLKQWHNQPSAEFGGVRMGDYFEGFVQDEARQLGKTPGQIQAWQPPEKPSRQRKKAGT